MSDNQEIILDVINHIGIIELNRLNRLNALSFSMIKTIKNQLVLWEKDISIHLVYISSLSDVAFCAGGDIVNLYEHAINDDIEFVSLYLSTQYAMDYIIQTYSKPIVSFVNGYVLGGGAGLSMGSRYFIVSERAKFGMPETQIGFFPDVGASYFLNKLPNHIGRYLGLLGEVIDHHELIYLNMADYHITEVNWKLVIDKLYTTIWKKEEMDTQLKTIFEIYKSETKPTYFIKHEQQIKDMFSYNQLTDMIKQMSIKDDYLNSIKDKLLTKSPTALAVTLELLKKGEGKKLIDCLKMEHDLSLSVVKTADFKEGVRSLLVVKDKRFKWNPKSYLDIDLFLITNMFTLENNYKKHPIDISLGKDNE